MAIQMRRGNLADFDPTKQMPGEFAVTLDTDSNLNKRVYIAFAAGTVKQLMTVEDATAQMIEATDAATAEAEAWAHGNSFTATEMFTSAGSATVTLAYSPSSINVVKINDVATTAYTRNDKVITFNTAPAVGSTITVIYGVSTSTDNAKYYKEQAANSASTASTKATQASTSATNAANSASTASTKATQAGNSATLSESYAVGGTGTRSGEDTDNAKYYKDQMAAYLSGIYHFIGSVNSYADLPTMGMVRGDTYDILTADPTHEIAAGDNVAWTGTRWDKLSGTIATMIGATASSNGAKGLVPAPMIADKDNFLRGDGTWANPNTAVDDVYSVMGQMGAKNLLVPEWVETHTTENGVTYTFNADGTIIMNTDASGATANTNCNLRQNTVTTNNVFPAGTYTLTACPAGGSSTTYRTWARAYRPGTNTALTDNLYEEGNGVSFTVSEPFSLGLNVTVRSGYVCNNLTWKPMLRYASDTDNTYQPYAMTNKQLTEDKADKTDIESVYSVMGQNGAKNLIPYPYYRSSGYVHRSVTYTVDNNGKITANGTATGGNSYFEMRNAAYETFKLKPNTRYIISGCPSGGGDSTYLLSVSYNVGGGSSTTLALDFGNGAEFTTPQNADANYTISVRIVSGTATTNLLFEPMLRLASDTDDTYQPYAKTNKQLTDELDTAREQIATKIGTFTINATNHPNATSNLNVRQAGNVVSIQGYITGLTVGNNVIGKISGVSLPPTHIRFLANSTTQPWETGDAVYATIDMTDNTLTSRITKTALNISVTYII